MGAKFIDGATTVNLPGPNYGYGDQKLTGDVYAESSGGTVYGYSKAAVSDALTGMTFANMTTATKDSLMSFLSSHRAGKEFVYEDPFGVQKNVFLTQGDPVATRDSLNRWSVTINLRGA